MGRVTIIYGCQCPAIRSRNKRKLHSAYLLSSHRGLCNTASLGLDLKSGASPKEPSNPCLPPPACLPRATIMISEAKGFVYIHANL